MTWNESFMDYAVQIAKIYKNNPEQIICCLKFDSVAGSLNETYKVLTRSSGELVRIEELSKEEKLKLWEQAKQYSDAKEKCIVISRCIHLLNALIA